MHPFFFFFFNDTATTEIYTLSLHDALPICKNVFTRDRFEQDRQRILTYYQDHGFPEARIGNAQVTQSNESTGRWFPWPHESTLTGLSVSIPVEAGPFYRFESIAATDALQQAAKEGGRLPVNVPDL